MRLWHYKLIPVLPDKQLIGQWRELNSIFKNQNKHVLINFVYDYSKEHLLLYSNLVLKELRARNFSIRIMDNYHLYFDGIISTGNVNKCFPEIMNNTYLRECLYNLEEKAMRNAMTQKEWEKIYEKFNNDFELWRN